MFAPLVILLSALAVLPAAAQVTQKKIATLGPGEIIVTGETHLLTGQGPGCTTEDFFIVSQSTGGAKSRFFTYDKSGRKGPFEKITESMLRAGASYDPLPAYYVSEASIEGIEEDGNRLIFKGKTFGPFQQVLQIQVTPDKSRFYALVAKAGALRFIGSDGRDVPAAGMAGNIMISPDGTKAVATCRGTLTLIDGVKVDMSKIDPSTFDDVYLYTIDGAKLGPFHQNQDFGEVWFAAGSQNWLFDLGQNIYFNGKLILKFGERIDKERFWIDDEKHYAWVEGDELGFEDGAKYPYPVMIRHEKSAGKTALCWISVQKNGDVAAYQRTL